jgi:chromosome segregation ATPase
VTELDEIRARMEALERANETLHVAFRGVDGDAHEALAVAMTNVKLMTTLRATQLEHGRALGGLVTQVVDLRRDVEDLQGGLADIGTDVSLLKIQVAGVTTGLTDLKTDVNGVKTDVADLKTDAAEIKTSLAEVLRRLPE